MTRCAPPVNCNCQLGWSLLSPLSPSSLVAFIARMVPFSTGGFHSPDSSACAKTLSPLLSDHVQGFHTSKLLTLKEELDCPKLLGLAALLAGWHPSCQSTAVILWWVGEPSLALPVSALAAGQALALPAKYTLHMLTGHFSDLVPISFALSRIFFIVVRFGNKVEFHLSLFRCCCTKVWLKSRARSCTKDDLVEMAV